MLELIAAGGGYELLRGLMLARWVSILVAPSAAFRRSLLLNSYQILSEAVIPHVSL